MTLSAEAEIEGEFAAIAAPNYTLDSGWLSVDRDAVAPTDLFYVHPTTWAGPGWFADPFIAEVDAAVATTALSHISAFPGRVWAPRYRHATSRAFREIGRAGDVAYSAAYRDVERAFQVFLAHSGDRPFILAGHSQGARHVLSLLADHVVGTPWLPRLIAAYVPGVGVPVDTFAARYPGLELTGRPGSSGTVLSWNTFLDGADPRRLLARTAGTIACVNPLTFDGRRPHAGTETHLHNRQEAPRVAARSADGVLFVTPEVAGSLDAAALPGGNLHTLDIPLFTTNIRTDAVRRIAAHHTRTAPR